jgi:hypothetical protein
MDETSFTDTFEFAGCNVGGLRVPGFRVQRGEILKIEFALRNAKEMHHVKDLILREFRRAGRVEGIELPMTRSGLRELFHRQTAVEFLVANSRLNDRDAAASLEELQVKPDMPLGMLAGNPRWMIGFLGAMSRRPDALVFTTTGCDATGMERGLAAVSGRLGNTAAIYLSCFNDLEIVEPEYAAVFEVQSQEQRVA